MDTMKWFVRWTVVAALLLGTGTAAFGARVDLTGPNAFYFSLAGDDATGDGSFSAPWRTLQHSYDYVQSNYDTHGFLVSFNSKDSSGTYPDCFVASGPLFGNSNSYGLVLINLNGTTVEPSSSSNCNSSLYAIGANFGASFTLQNVTMSVCGTWPQDMLNIGQGSIVAIGSGVTFGCAYQPWNHASVNGKLVIQSNYTIQAATFATTGTWSSGGSTITVASTAGLRSFYGITGAGIADDCFIASIVGNVVSAARAINGRIVACTFSASGSGSALTFRSGANGHWGAGTYGFVETANNNVPGLVNVFVVGNPFFFQGFAYGLQISNMNVGAITFQIGGASGPQFISEGNSVIYSHGMGVPYFPGNYQGSLTANVTAGSANATLSAGGQLYVEDGAAINDHRSATNCTMTSGNGAATGCASASNCIAGAVILNSLGIATGSVVTSVSGSTINFTPPAIGSGVGSINCVGSYISPGTTIVSGGVGTNIVLSQPAIKTGNVSVAIGGFTRFGGKYQ